MLRHVGGTMLAVAAALAVAGPAADAKGPYRVVLSGGDLSSPITVGEDIDTIAMFGDGTRIDPPLPYPRYIYTLELHYEGEDAAVPSVSTLSYYPAHEGLSAALQTSTGSFFAVAEEFDSLLRSLLSGSPSPSDSPETGGGTSPLWYLAPGLALGSAIGSFLAWTVRRRSTRRGVTAARS